MRYPTLTRSKTEKLLEELIEGQSPPVLSEAQWVGSGEDLHINELRECVDSIREEHARYWADESAVSEEDFEGRASGPLFELLRALRPGLLDDPGFWRYFSLDQFWWFIKKREAKAIKNGNAMKYVNGEQSTECVPLRMFLRAQSIAGDDGYALAYSMPKATDFWRSHIIRVQTGSAPQLARAFAALQAEVGMNTNEVRAFARKINRLWKNIAFHRLSELECKGVLNEVYRQSRGAV